MRNRPTGGLLVLVLAAALVGCDDLRPPSGSVTGPTATVSAGVVSTGVPANVTISGVVYDTAHRLLSGARVEVIEGTRGDWCHYNVQPAPECIVSAATNESGRFLFSGPFASVTRLRASKDGYLPATVTIDSTTSTGAIEFRLEPSLAP